MGNIITIKNLGKKYNITHQQGGYVALRDILTNIAKSPFKFLKYKAKKMAGMETKEEFWALKNVNLEIQKGEVIGIIGANGAGKSTLLKILTGITPPTEGEIIMRGKVASLLEVGTGFHPELTGRENIFLNGAILGMTKKEIARKFDEIVAFAGIEKFLDTPVKYYSSGMYVRLAFSVAAHMEPDILLVDEVLAVGDAEFQKKCLGKMEEVTKKGGRTILFVSHNMGAIEQLCRKTILFDKGKIKAIGNTREVIEKYLARHVESKNIIDYIVYENNNLKLEKITCNNSKKSTLLITSLPSYLNIEIDFEAKEINRVTLETHLKDSHGNHLAVCVPGHMDPKKNVYSISPGKHTLTARIGLPKLNNGNYYLDLSFTDPGIQRYLTIENAVNLNVLGYSSEGGITFEASPNGAGYQILDGDIMIK